MAFTSFDVKRGTSGTLGSSKSTLYTAPPTGRGVLVLSIYLCNTHTADVGYEIYRKETTGTSKHLTGDTSSLKLAGSSGAVNVLQQGPVILEPGDSIEGQAGTASVIEYSLSMLELS